MTESTSLSDSRVFLSMPNPWIIHEFDICGKVSNDLIEESMIASLKDNNLLGAQVSMDAKTGKAVLFINEQKPAPIEWNKKFLELDNNRSAQILENKELVFVDFFKNGRNKVTVRLYTHHVVCDGKGGLILINDFIKELNARLKKENPDYSKKVVPVSKYSKFMMGNPKLPLVEKLGILYFNKFVASKRPELSYEEMLSIQKQAFTQEGFVFKALSFTEEETKKIIQNAKGKGSTVTSYLLEKIAATYEYDKIEVSVSIDGRKYYNVPEDEDLLSVEENPSNFATGGKLIIDKVKFPKEEDILKDITKQLKNATEVQNAAKMIKTFSLMDFSLLDISAKFYAKLPMTEEEEKAHKALGKTMGFTITQNGFDFASFGKIQFIPTEKEYSIESFRLIQNTASVYPLKFGITTYKDCMSIILTYKPSLLDNETTDKIVEKIRTSVL